MSRSFNYSKWDNIELSDDESDLHPNIDKESWFRMKHRTRLEREQKEDMEMAEYDKLTKEDSIRMKVLNTRMKRTQSGVSLDEEEEEGEDLEALQGELKELETRIQVREKRKKEIMERRDWNIDNICKVKEEKSVVNKASSTSLAADSYVPSTSTSSTVLGEETSSLPEAVPMPLKDTTSTPSIATKPAAATTSSSTSKTSASTSSSTATMPSSPRTVSTAPTLPAPAAAEHQPERERFSAINYNDFALKHEAILERYSELQSLEESKDFLFKHCDVLLHEHAQSYMLLSCLEDEINRKHDRMKLVCRQSQILTHIQELGTQLKRDPRDVILPFFLRISHADYFKGFQQAVAEFTQRIVERAVVKRKELDEEAQRNDEGERRLGPGGLDPLEVLQQLPADLAAAFESQDTEKLQKVLLAMKPKDAQHYMKMCVDSGLWVPQNSAVFENEHEFEEEGEEEEEAEEVGK